jgi:hypothetical protein
VYQKLWERYPALGMGRVLPKRQIGFIFMFPAPTVFFPEGCEEDV